jgi:putative transposase
VTLKRTRHLDIYITIKELIEEHPDYPVNRLCKFGHITRASYYKWKNRVDVLVSRATVSTWTVIPNWS